MREVKLFPDAKLYLLDKIWQEKQNINSEKLADEDALEKLTRALSLPQAPSWLQQVHGVTVWDFDENNNFLPKADAAITKTPGKVLAIRTADCFSVALYASAFEKPTIPTIALLHVGWRGAAANIIAEGVKALRKKFAFQKDKSEKISDVNIYAWIGAGIRHYQVDAVVLNSFLSQAKDYENFFEKDENSADHYWLNLSALLRWQLLNAGVQSIVDSTWCTWQDAALYSHRRGDKARLLTLFYLLPSASVNRFV
jgi:YfiH family protein